jgi:hypothetical protein
VVELSLSVIAALTATAFLAGVVDAIAGGGGLLTVPALLASGLPPHTVFGTNKGSAVFGSAAALWRFWRARMIDGSTARWVFPVGFVGSLLGARALLFVDPRVLRPVALVLLVVAAAVVALVRPPEVHRHPVARPRRRAIILALLVGAYDGFFGPGTGTFLIVGFVVLMGWSLKQSSANAKVVNFASNLAAVLVFASQDVIVWSISLPMAVGQFLGGSVGAHLAVTGGDRLVRRVVLVVVIGLVVKLSFDLFGLK